MEAQENKPHHAPHQKTKSVDVHNIKAFGYAQGMRAKKAIAHQLNIEQIRLFQPPTRKTTPEDPPLVVAVQGPPGCGKSLLIRCLIRHYSRQRVIDLKGPVTVAISKVQRITFIEVGNDINSMMDAAKVADLVLLLVNAEHGFEMETFEFLNLLLSHGFPKIMGIITHLDLVDKSVGNDIKARFRKELNVGVKVYKLERLINDKYEKKSIQALARLLNQAKIRVLSFREGRGYCLVDRAEKHPTDPTHTYVYGYARGAGFKDGDKCHLAGIGDCTVLNATILEDPCPIVTKKASTRTLLKAQRSIHAPMSTLGGVQLDDDGTGTIDIPANQINFTDLRKDAVGITEEQAQEIEADIEETDGVKKIRDLMKSSNKDDSNEEEDDEMMLIPGVKVQKEEHQKAKEEHEQLLKEKEEASKSSSTNSKPKATKQTSKKEEENEEEEEDYNEEEENQMDNEDDGELNDEDGEEVAPIEQEEGKTPAGKYIRLEFDDIPSAFIEKLDPTHPIIVGTLFDNELEVTQQWVKIKKHRFYERAMKSTDPLIVSIGWRRYQTIPIFFNEDRGGRLTFLKYLKDLSTNYVTFYGPASAINVGVTAFQHIKEQLVNFRVSGTGVTIKQLGNGIVYKKLRVKGFPKKGQIHSSTAIITGMFSSAMETSKFSSALVKTVSGIRGVIKSVDANGDCRCSFEGKIVESDIVNLNCWVPVEVTKFYSEIKNFLTEDIPLIRTYAELRSDLNLRPQYNEDSVYKPVIREEKEENPLKVPKNIRENLPYKLRRQEKNEPKPRAVVPDQHEAHIMNTFSKMKALFDKQQKEKAREQYIQERTNRRLEKEAEKEMLHKRTKRKQEFFSKHPNRAKH